LRSRSGRLRSFLLLLASAPGLAAAQDAAAARFGEEIVVTGSRVERNDRGAPGPVTVVSREQLEASGKISLGDFLQTLPEQGNALNTAVNNGGDGSTRIALRGLGSQRTLVLVNGRRFVPGGVGADGSVDLSGIPAAAIERVEVLKDGASAAYGSDAIAGVVNVITRTRLDGTELSAFGGTTTRGDGTTYDLSVTTGTVSERGHLLLSAGFFDQRPIMAADRSFSAVPLALDASGLNNPFGDPPGPYTVGSPTVPAGSISIPASAAGVPVACAAGDERCATWNQVLAAFPAATKFVLDPQAPPCAPGQSTGCQVHGVRPFIPNALPPRGDAYNFQGENYLLTPQQRISLFATGDARLGELARARFEASYVNRQSSQRLASEPLVIGPGGESVTISGASIYNPFGVDFTQANRRLVEFGPRRSEEDIDTIRIVAGLDGALPPAAGPLAGWGWEVSLNYGRTQGTSLSTNNLEPTRLQQALGPSFRDASGRPTCGTPASPIPGCVPLDLFGGPGSITPDMIPGLAYTGTQRGTNEMTDVVVGATGDLGSLFADRSVRLAVGYELLRVAGSAIPDPVTLAATGGAITEGAYTTNAGYAELSAPLVDHVRYAELVEATAAARLFHAAPFGTEWTYKLGARWAVGPDLALRGTWSTAFRAPSVSDLYAGQVDSFAGVSDPCASPSPPAACAATPVGDARGNGDDRGQLPSRVGGNPSLQPETAGVFTAGVVLEPAFLPGLAVTLDYWNIGIDHAISQIGESAILAGCYPSDPTKAPAFCDLVVRDPVTKQVTSIVNLNRNVGAERTDGLDLAARYVLRTRALGRFAFAFDGTYLYRYDKTLPDGTVVHGRGTFDMNNQAGAVAGVGGVFPAVKFNAGVVWALGPVGAGLSTRFIGAFDECGDPAGDFSGGGLCYQDATFRRHVSAQATFDAGVSYALASAAGRTTFRAGVQNVFDAKPAVIYNGFLAATDPTTYDVAGRFVYLRVTHAL
jgi:outer membrane receptor protein involved in Fe transport